MCDCNCSEVLAAVAAARATVANAATALRHADVRAVELQAENEAIRAECRALRDRVRRLEAERLEPVARLRPAQPLLVADALRGARFNGGGA